MLAAGENIYCDFLLRMITALRISANGKNKSFIVHHRTVVTWADDWGADNEAGDRMV